jgi:hypothetical protein
MAKSPQKPQTSEEEYDDTQREMQIDQGFGLRIAPDMRHRPRNNKLDC